MIVEKVVEKYCIFVYFDTLIEPLSSYISYASKGSIA